ncbi:hypothetical protein [uncultured Desulfobacter sp.]|uniref:hypothetical protein n=1 Tax=uncultured Desulfobacter sp. TaxID=240139 RepID=UPI002AABBB76|nr:hypothetical protein [uncultured Desulfobacter sp.]
MDSFALKEKDRVLLNQGGIVVQKDGELYYKRIGASRQVVTMGTLPELDPPMHVEMVFWSMVVVNFALMTLLWTLPFWLKLRCISRRLNVSAKRTSQPGSQYHNGPHCFPWPDLLMIWPEKFNS